MEKGRDNPSIGFNAAPILRKYLVQEPYTGNNNNNNNFYININIINSISNTIESLMNVDLANFTLVTDKLARSIALFIPYILCYGQV